MVKLQNQTVNRHTSIFWKKYFHNLKNLIQTDEKGIFKRKGKGLHRILVILLFVVNYSTNRQQTFQV